MKRRAARKRWQQLMTTLFATDRIISLGNIIMLEDGNPAFYRATVCAVCVMCVAAVTKVTRGDGLHRDGERRECAPMVVLSFRVTRTPSRIDVVVLED